MPNCYPNLLSDLETIACMSLKHRYEVNNEGILVAYGDNDKGQLGVGDFNARIEPTAVELPIGEKITQLFVRDPYTLALCESGNVYAWGDNSVGQLGVGDFKNREKPTIVALPSEEKVFRLYVEWGSVLALCESGNVYDWGYSSLVWLLGRGYVSNPNVPTPQRVTALNAHDLTSVVWGKDYVLALTQKGEILAWGQNRSGQLGFDSNGRPVDKPTKITTLFGHHIIKIAASLSHSAALTAQNELYMWGNNYSGELGLGDRRNRCDPTRVILPEGKIADIYLGSECTAVLYEDGRVYTWGNNIHGTLGRPADFSCTCPTLVNIEPVKKLYVCKQHMAAICPDGSIFVWGCNDNYQLGVSDKRDRFTPTELKVRADIGTTIEILFKNNIGIARQQNNSEIYIWGNINGEIIQTPRKLSTILQNRSASPLGHEKMLMNNFPLDYLQQLFVLPDTHKLIHLIEKGSLEDIKALLDAGCKFSDISLQEIVKAFNSSKYCSVRALFNLFTDEMLPASLNVATLHLALVLEQMSSKEKSLGNFDLTHPENQLNILCQHEAFISGQLEYYDQQLMTYAARECCDRRFVIQLINLGFKSRSFGFVPYLASVHTTNKGSCALPYFDSPLSPSYIGKTHAKKRYLEALKSDGYEETQDEILGEYVLIALDLLESPNEEIKNILENKNNPGYRPDLIKMVCFVISFSAYAGKTEIFSSINLFKLMEKLNIFFSQALVKDSRSSSYISEGVSPIYLATVFNNKEFIRKAKVSGLVSMEEIYYSVVITASYNNTDMMQFLLEEFEIKNENWSEKGPNNKYSLNPLVCAIQQMDNNAFDLLIDYKIGIKFFKNSLVSLSTTPVEQVLCMLGNNLPAEKNEWLLNTLKILISKGAITKYAEVFLKLIKNESIKERATAIVERANSIFPKKISEEPIYSKSQKVTFARASSSDSEMSAPSDCSICSICPIS